MYFSGSFSKACLHAGAQTANVRDEAKQKEEFMYPEPMNYPMKP